METKQFLDASRFLRALDPTSDQFTFQIFDDLSPKRKHLSKVISGSLQQLWPRLVWYNKQKAGIHVCVQETDLQGRKKENIRSIRSVYVDNDGKLNMDNLPLPPSMVVETSPLHTHIYYLLHSKLSTANGHKKDFDRVMASLCEKGGDPGAKDIAHTLRMPGFLNWKRNRPSVTKLLHLETDFLDDPVRYSWDTLKNQFVPVSEITQDDLNLFFDTEVPIIKNPFKIALIASALDTIDPDCEHSMWTTVGMALHYESNGNQQGYELFQNWSMQGSKHNEFDWPNQWNYFKNDGKERYVTLGSLFHIARQEFGWDGRYSPHLPNIDALIKQERINNFEYLNQYYALIPVGSEMRILFQGQNDLKYYGYHLLSKAGANMLFATDTIPKISRDKKGNVTITKEPRIDEWIKYPKRNYYEGFCFEPSADIHMGDHPSILKPGIRYNTYIGLSNEGREHDCEIIKQHIFDIWCKGVQERYDYVLNWLARMYQYPGQPAETLLILTSMQGAGKNIILDEIRKSFGRFGKTDRAGDNIIHDFNSILLDAVCIVISEASFDSTVKQRAIIKDLATSDIIGATKKFEDLREVKNCVHLICLSNEERPIRIDFHDRRHYILRCDNRYVKDFDYFAKLKKKIEEGAMDGFIRYLRHRDISKFRPQVMPTSERGLKSSLMVGDPKGILAFVRSALEVDNWFFPLGPKENGYGMEAPNQIPLDRLYLAYESYCQEQKSKNFKLSISSLIGFSRKLSEIFKKKIKKKRMAVPDRDNKRPTYYELPSLQTLRDAYDKFAGAPHDWGDEDDELDDLDFLQ